jgi:hypothetical protein
MFLEAMHSTLHSNEEEREHNPLFPSSLRAVLCPYVTTLLSRSLSQEQTRQYWLPRPAPCPFLVEQVTIIYFTGC